MCRNSNIPKGVIIAVFLTSSGATWAASFPTRHKELYTSEPCHRDSDDTSTGQENLNGVRRKEGQMDGRARTRGWRALGASTGNIRSSDA